MTWNLVDRSPYNYLRSQFSSKRKTSIIFHKTMGSICTDTLEHEDFSWHLKQFLFGGVIQLSFQIANNKTSLCILIGIFVLCYVSSGTYFPAWKVKGQRNKVAACVFLYSSQILHLHLIFTGTRSIGRSKIRLCASHYLTLRILFKDQDQ